uniref:Uncharacterized protein n=1 Tax=Romanomermis culicivorax TaxID=13658 RepID=A0A915J5H9_ROMCU
MVIPFQIFAHVIHQIFGNDFETMGRRISIVGRTVVRLDAQNRGQLDLLVKTSGCLKVAVVVQRYAGGIHHPVTTHNHNIYYFLHCAIKCFEYALLKLVPLHIVNIRTQALYHPHTEIITKSYNQPHLLPSIIADVGLGLLVLTDACPGILDS